MTVHPKPNLLNVLITLKGSIAKRRLSEAQAVCERIKSTPLPFPYTLLLHRTIYIFCVFANSRRRCSRWILCSVELSVQRSQSRRHVMC